jgi:hypothetical protein
LITEIEFFNEIFEDFVCSEENFNDNEIWKSNSIIKLMRSLDGIKDSSILEEGLKIILTLCKFRDLGCLHDPYKSESIPIQDIMEHDRIILNSILIAEFT